MKNAQHDDFVQPFQLETSQLRGRLVRLGSAVDTVLQQHAYPQPVAQLLAETMAVAAALATALKYDGVFTLQSKGDGPVRLLVADVTSEGGVRGYAQFDQERMVDGARGLGLLGKGYLAFTVTQPQTNDRYQGIVELKNDNPTDNMASAVQHYFQQSEQLPTGLTVHAVADEKGSWRAGCLMLQRMPRSGGIWTGSDQDRPNLSVVDDAAEEDWARSVTLMETCRADEILSPELPPADLLYRLFHQEGVRVYEARLFDHQCRCSEKRVRNMLRSLPRDEVEKMAVDDIIKITCEFCNRHYAYDRQQRDELYQDAGPPPPANEP